MKKYRLLTAEEIECRVSTISEKGVALLLYKTARTDADILDETVGSDRWTNDFKLVDGVLYGGIGVDYGSGYVWKWDAGTESNTEAEKGRASDAFKRAGFKHGIGRELYSSPFIWIKAEDTKIEKNDKGRWNCKDSFSVKSITYDSAERIKTIEIINENGKSCFSFGDERKQKQETKLPKTETKSIKCEKCGKAIADYRGTSAIEIANKSKNTFGRYMCAKCAIAEAKNADNGSKA